MKLLLKTLCCLACGFLLNGAPAAAQAPPDAGRLLQEQRQPRTTLPDRLPEDKEKETKAPEVTDTGIRVQIKGFRFTGGEGIATEAELQEVVRGSIGKEFDIAELQQIASLVTDYLRDKKGYLLARAYLPKQDITGGVITIAIVSGRIDGKVKIKIREPARISASLLAGIASRAVPADSPARMEQIERAVLLIKDLPGMDARAYLEPGTKPGTAGAVIDASEGPLFRGSLSVDNFGDHYTGANRAAGQFSTNDPFGLGDQLSLSYTYTERLNNFQAAYSLPVWDTGFTWNAAYSGFNYELGQEMAGLNAKGWASSFSSGIAYPLIRTRKKTIRANAGVEYLGLSDEALGQKNTDRKLLLGTGSVSGLFLDGFGGGGLSSASVVFTGGNVDLSGLASYKDSDQAGAGTQGGFWRGVYNLARLQRLIRQVSLYGNARGQLASGNLDSSQKFILGGPSGVRAYPVGEASGDEGHILTLEARYDLPFTFSWGAAQLVGFGDTGWVKLHKYPWSNSIANATGKNDYLLSGCGMGVNIGKDDRYNLRASYAHKIGANDGRNSSGNDADNHNSAGRFWLQLMVWL